MTQPAATPVEIGRQPSPAPSTPVFPELTARRAFHLLAKPTGPICNLDCEYCFFLSKETLYPGDRFRMTDHVAETYIGQLLESQPDGEVIVAWQGGEPTLMGIDFFRHTVALAERLRRPGQRLLHTIQTNGTLLTDEWAQFLAEHRFLVGLSIDGPPELHDRYRVDKKGRPSSERVLSGLTHLQDSGVDVNVLCTVNAANQAHPLDVYRYFRDELGLRHMQFIPIVERENDTGFQEGDTVTDRSVDPAAWGGVPHHDLRRVGSARRGRGVRADVRRCARLVVGAPIDHVHLPPHVRRRARTGAQRRRLLL